MVSPFRSPAMRYSSAYQFGDRRRGWNRRIEHKLHAISHAHPNNARNASGEHLRVVSSQPTVTCVSGPIGCTMRTVAGSPPAPSRTCSERMPRSTRSPWPKPNAAAWGSERKLDRADAVGQRASPSRSRINLRACSFAGAADEFGYVLRNRCRINLLRRAELVRPCPGA